MKKWLLVLGAFLCLYLVLPVPFASAAEWTEIRTDDQTLYVSPGVWRITAGNPSSSSSIDVNKPIHASSGRLVGYAAEIREPWRFILQQAVPSGWRNPGLYDQRQAAYFIPVDGSTHAVFFTHVRYGGANGKTVTGVKGTCRSPRNGQTLTVVFER